MIHRESMPKYFPSSGLGEGSFCSIWIFVITSQVCYIEVKTQNLESMSRGTIGVCMLSNDAHPK